MGKNGIADRMTHLGERARGRMTHARMEKLDRDNDRLRDEVAMLRDDLQEERSAHREALKTLGDGHRPPRPERPHVVRALVIAGAAYVVGTRAGRERYEAIVARVRALADTWRRASRDDAAWSEPDVRPNGAVERATDPTTGVG